MEALGILILWLLVLIPFGYVLYFIVRAAVRDGILAAKERENILRNADRIEQVVCPKCGKQYGKNEAGCPDCDPVNPS